MDYLPYIVFLPFVVLIIAMIWKLITRKKPEGYYEYRINKGHHFADGKRFIGKPEKFVVWIDYMWWYDDLMPDAHWNKLIGWSEDTHHHKNSIRIAWRSTNKMIRFALYAYVDGVRVVKEFSRHYMLEQKVSMAIKREEGNYIVMVGDQCLAFPALDGKKYTYTLMPYFGGSEPAPHDMRFVFYFNTN